MLCEKEINRLNDWAEDLIIELGIKYTVEELVNNFKKIYHYIDIDKHILRIHGNEYIPDDLDPNKNKQKKVQVYNLKAHDQYDMDFEQLRTIYTYIIELCIAIEKLKLFKKIEEEEAKKSEMMDILYDEKFRSFLKRKK